MGWLLHVPVKENITNNQFYKINAVFHLFCQQLKTKWTVQLLNSLVVLVNLMKFFTKVIPFCKAEKVELSMSDDNTAV